MNLFLDTSSLIKLYHIEEKSRELRDLFSSGKIESVYLSELAKVEFDSAIWKNIRMGNISVEVGKMLVAFFNRDREKYEWVEMKSQILDTASNKISEYGGDGLRSLDSLQLSSALYLRECGIPFHFISSDFILGKIAAREGLKCLMQAEK